MTRRALKKTPKTPQYTIYQHIVLCRYPVAISLIQENPHISLNETFQAVLGNNTPTSMGTPLFFAICNQVRPLIDILLEKENINLTDVTPNNLFYVNLAIEFKDYTTARILIEKGVDPNTQNAKGETPLMLAIRNRVRPLINVLFAQKDINITALPAPYQLSYVNYAVKFRDYKTARILIEKGADPNTQNAEGETPLMLAIRNRIRPLINVLLAQKDINITALPAPYQFSYVNYAVKFRDYTTARILIEKGVDPNTQDAEGVTPLMLACCDEKINIKFIQFLAEHGANMNPTLTASQISILNNILLLKERENTLEAIDLLLDLGTQPNPATSDMLHPLYALLMRDDRHATDKNIAILESFLKNGVHTHHVLHENGDDLSLLHLTVDFNKKALVQHILNGDLIDPNVTGQVSMPVTPFTTEHDRIIISEWTPLHAAAITGHNIFITKTLLNKGANPLNLDSMGRMPLHWAVRSDDSYGEAILAELQQWEQSIVQVSHSQNKRGAHHTQIKPLSEEFNFMLRSSSEGVRTRIVEQLLLADADKTSLYHPDQAGDIPLHTAVYNIANQDRLVKSAAYIVDRLLKADKNYRKALAEEGRDRTSMVHMTNHEGNTALHILAYSTQANKLDDLKSDTKEIIIKYREKIIKQLIEAGASPYLQNHAGDTPFEIMPKREKILIASLQYGTHSNRFFEGTEQINTITEATRRLSL